MQRQGKADELAIVPFIDGLDVHEMQPVED